MPIGSFSDVATEEFFVLGKTKRRVSWQAIGSIITRKLDMLNYATLLTDLRSPPGNRLEALKGNLLGYHSIRVNDQWRVVFRWTPSGPIEVKICDYH